MRVLAVQKLAAAYRIDEVASSVMVMQGGSLFDDIAERVLRVGEFPANWFVLNVQMEKDNEVYPPIPITHVY